MARFILMIILLQCGTVLANAELDEAKSQFLQSIVKDVYSGAMQELLIKNKILSEQLNNTCQPHGLQGLESFEQAWVDTYMQWKHVESYILGPVSNKKLQRQLGFWPTRDAFIKRLISGDLPITLESLPMLSIASKGYPALEWIIFIQLNTDLTERERQRYCELSHLLIGEIGQLVNESLLAYENDELLEILSGERELTLFESVYSQQPFAEWLSTIGSAQYDIRKLYLIKPAGLRPGTRAQPSAVDAYLSGQSLASMLARWEAMKVIYLGEENTLSLYHLVNQFDEVIALQLKAMIDIIDQQITELPNDDLPNIAEHSRPILEALALALANLEALLQVEVAKVLETQSLFSDDDGD